MADISQEINDFKNAIYGEEVRGSMISLAEKLNTEVESNTTNVNQAVETANTASTAANQAVEDANTTLQAANQAVTTAAGSAEDAEESATAAANSATAAAGSAEDAEESATAAANSATAAAQSAADAAEAAEGLEGFNGQASSVKAEDTEGLVGTAGGQTNVQALIDYIADQVKNQLVSDSALTTKLAKYILKSQIINNLLATQAGNVLDAVQGKALSDMIGDTSQLPEGAGNVVGAVAQLNSDIGSNANGSYIKFANGFLICWYHGVVTDQTINNPYGTLFQGTRTMTFPIRFVSPPAATCSLFRWGASASWGTVSSCSASTCIIRGIDISVREAGTETEISYIAIGKWK